MSEFVSQIFFDMGAAKRVYAEVSGTTHKVGSARWQIAPCGLHVPAIGVFIAEQIDFDCVTLRRQFKRFKNADAE